MSNDLQNFLAEVRAEFSAAGEIDDFDDYQRHFEMARRVLELRQERGLTQAALSAASGVQQSEISRIERGQGNPTFQTMAHLARALGMKVAFVPDRKRQAQRTPHPAG